MGKSSRGGEEGPAGAAGETERVSPTAGPRGIPVPRQGAPGEQRLLWGHSLVSARSRAREARNVLFDDLLSWKAVKNVPLE